MAGVSITINGDAAITAGLKKAAAQLAAPEDLYADIGDALITSTQLRFEQGNAPDGNPWPKSIRAMMEGKRTLIGETQELWKRITKEVSPTGVRVGTNVIYAAVHQFGATIRAKNKKYLAFKVGGKTVLKQSVTIPARPFLGLSKADEREIEELVDQHLAKMLPNTDGKP